MDTWDWGRVRGNSRRSSTSFSQPPSLPRQAAPDRHSHRWQRIWDVLRLIQPGAPLESNVQRDMKWDVTCCTVTFPEQFSILMAEEVHELLSPCVRKRPHT